VLEVPLVAIDPLHAQLPLAVHEAALLLDQAIVDVAPEAIVVGVSETFTVGKPAAVTVTVADPCAVPPAPVQARL
jgi:hypothetical protein